MNLHNHLASINWRFNYFSKFNPGAEALRIDISVLTHYRYVTNQIFSFAFPVATTSMDNHPQAVLSGIRRIQAGRLHGRCCHIHYSLQTYQRLPLLREFRIDNFILPCFTADFNSVIALCRNFSDFGMFGLRIPSGCRRHRSADGHSRRSADQQSSAIWAFDAHGKARSWPPRKKRPAALGC